MTHVIRRRSAGFTLTEILIAISIATFLIGGAIVAGTKLMAQARLTKTLTMLESVEHAVRALQTAKPNFSYPAMSYNGACAARFDDIMIAEKVINERLHFPVSTDNVVPMTPANTTTWDAANHAYVPGNQNWNYDNFIMTHTVLMVVTAEDQPNPQGGWHIQFWLDGANPLDYHRKLYVVVIPNVAIEDAIALSQAINGNLSTITEADPNQINGKLKVYTGNGGTSLYYLAGSE